MREEERKREKTRFVLVQKGPTRGSKASLSWPGPVFPKKSQVAMWPTQQVRGSHGWHNMGEVHSPLSPGPLPPQHPL